MPELPEVETVRRGLAPAMEGRAITHASVARQGLRLPFPERMAERLTGVRVLRIDRRGKYLLAALDSAETLLIHLGMSGRVLVSGGLLGGFHQGQPTARKHDHVVFDMADGVRIAFNDARRFGIMDLAPTDTVAGHRLLRDLGPEPLGNAFDGARLSSCLAGRTAPVKSILLDQSVVAGIGNIYASETLHRAGIAPARSARSLSGDETARLVTAIRDVLTEAIAAGGSSLRDYRQTDGAPGGFQNAFRVYGRDGSACPAHGCDGTIQRIVQAGRATFWCPGCQR